MTDMSAVMLNIVVLNRAKLNAVGEKDKPSDSGGGETPDIPSGYEEFMVAEGVFSAKDGEFYVKR